MKQGETGAVNYQFLDPVRFGKRLLGNHLVQNQFQGHWFLLGRLILFRGHPRPMNVMHLAIEVTDAPIVVRGINIVIQQRLDIIVARFQLGESSRKALRVAPISRC